MMSKTKAMKTASKAIRQLQIPSKPRPRTASTEGKDMKQQKFAVIARFAESRDPDGKSIIGMPCKMNADVNLPANRNAAIRKFNRWVESNPGKFGELVACTEKGDRTITRVEGDPFVRYTAWSIGTRP